MFVILLMYQMTNKVRSVYRIDIVDKKSVLSQYFQSSDKRKSILITIIIYIF